MFNNEIPALRAISSASSSSSSSSSSPSFDSNERRNNLNSPSDLITDEFELLNDDKEQQKKVNCVQFAQRVLEFSSQYGSDYSISYTACNITGRPSKFPNYGDFPETYAMRTYGEWWDLAPSRTTEIMPQTIPNNNPQDFIVVQFEEYIFPQGISIFETYNAGAICKIWAFTISDTWICLWESKGKAECIADPRAFTPTIQRIKIPAKIFRIEFNHRHLDYFTEIDGVLVEGIKYNCDKVNSSLSPINHNHHHHHRNHQADKGPIQRRLESVQFKPLHHNNHQDLLKDFLMRDLENFIAEINCGYGIDVPDDSENSKLTLKNLPSEILLKVFSFLDLTSLFRVSQTCRKIHEIACDPSLYTEINLKPYWSIVESPVLYTLSHRCRYLKKIDFSWCGLFTNLTPNDFKEFIRLCGKQITHLRLNSVKFLNADGLDTVSIICENLKELGLRNANLATVNSTTLERFKNLERLDLFRANISEDQIKILLKNNPELKHINLAFGSTLIDMDEIAITLSQNNKNIVSIDMWKSHGLSSVGLLALANCSDLEEVDFGWCLREEAQPGESLKELLKGCKKLKKIFLAAIRGLTDRDLENIAIYCPNLEQLDLLGVMGISTEKCYEILCKCVKLKLLDLSFCNNLNKIQIAYWRDRFSASIKRSFVRSDINYRRGDRPHNEQDI